MTESLLLTPKIIELNSSNDIYMTLKMVILSNQVNYNNLLFTDEFIDGIVENKKDYISIPLVVNRQKLEDKDFDNLNHEFADGKLGTDMIGAFVDFEKETDEDGVTVLIGETRIYKRFSKTCEAIKELYSNGDLKFSCEVMVKSYKEVTDDGIRVVDYDSGKNALFANCIVSDPAESRAEATILVAQALKKDIKNEKQGGINEMSEKSFNKDYTIKYHGKLEMNSLKLSDVSSILYNKLNPIDPKNGYRDYNFYISDIFVDHAIICNWDDDVVYRVALTIEKEDVILADKTDWVEGYKGFIPKGVYYEQLLALKDQELVVLNNKIKELQEEVKSVKTVEESQTELSAKETEVTELSGKVSTLEEKVAELNETVVSQETSKKELEATVTELNGKIEILTPFKDKVEEMEKAEKVAELNAKFSKIMSDETFKSEDVQNAIQELNESKLNEIVVSEVSKQNTEIEVNSQGDVTLPASKSKDLLPEDISSKYQLSI